MENNSIKLRLLLTLQALIKYSDENHRLTSVRLYKYLEPYGFSRSKKALRDTVRVLKEFGLDIGNRGCGGVWLKDSILPSEKLRTIVYAVSTNPYISSEQASEALNALTPFVTIYQEPLLNQHCINLSSKRLDSKFFQKYSIINEAIETQESVIYRHKYLIHNKKTDEIVITESVEQTFSPTKMFLYKNKIYMVGYNSADNKNEKIDISTISAIKLAKEQSPKLMNKDYEIINDFDFSSLFVDEDVIYSGKMQIKCKKSEYALLHQIFGSPARIIQENDNIVCEYEETSITPDMLFSISKTPDSLIKILGPDELISAIANYQNEILKINIEQKEG